MIVLPQDLSYEVVDLQTHQLVPFVLVKQQRLFQRPSDVGVSGNTLEVGGCKLGELVL